MARMAIQCRGTSSMNGPCWSVARSSGCAGGYRRRWVRHRRCWVATKRAMTDLAASPARSLHRGVTEHGLNRAEPDERRLRCEVGSIFSVAIRFSRAIGRSRSILPGAFRQCCIVVTTLHRCLPNKFPGLRGSGRGGRGFCFRTLAPDIFRDRRFLRGPLDRRFAIVVTSIVEPSSG